MKCCFFKATISLWNEQAEQFMNNVKFMESSGESTVVGFGGLCVLTYNNKKDCINLECFSNTIVEVSFAYLTRYKISLLTVLNQFTIVESYCWRNGCTDVLDENSRGI